MPPPDGGTLDLKNRLVVFPDGREEPLTVKEYGLVKHLATHPGRVITRDEILSRVTNMRKTGTNTPTSIPLPPKSPASLTNTPNRRPRRPS